jgi:thioredoxin 1
MLNRNDDDIQELIDGNTHVIVQFGASWCGPCKVLKPKVDKISFENSDIVFAYIDLETGEQFAQKMKVQAVPTVIGFHNSEIVETLVGPSDIAVKGLVEKLRTRVKNA